MINPECSLRYIVKYFTWFMVVLFKTKYFFTNCKGSENQLTIK